MLSSVLFYLSLPFITVIFCCILLLIVGKVLLGIHISYKSKAGMVGKTVLITGGSRGIGKAVAKDLAHRGARVIIAARNCITGEQAVHEIIEKSGNSEVFYMHLDLSNLDSVKEFVTQFLETEEKLDVLINNAGVYSSGSSDKSATTTTTKQGFEYVFGTNYVGHFLLTFLLEDLLRRSAPCRIINVSSVMHLSVTPIDFHNLVPVKNGVRYPQLIGYRTSKLANVMHAVTLADMFTGTGVTANSIHPGIIKSDIWFPVFDKFPQFLTRLAQKYIELIGVNEEAGAEPIIYLAVDEKVTNMSGKYFDRCLVQKAQKMSHKPENCWILWNLTKEMCGIISHDPDRLWQPGNVNQSDVRLQIQG